MEYEYAHLKRCYVIYFFKKIVRELPFKNALILIKKKSGILLNSFVFLARASRRIWYFLPARIYFTQWSL